MNNKILKLREEIDRVDNKLFRLLEKRFQITKKIINEKKKMRIVINDKSREKGLIDRESNKSRLNKRFVNDIYKLIFKESKKI